MGLYKNQHVHKMRKTCYTRVMITANIADTELVAHINTLPQDQMVIFVLAEGRARGAVFGGTRFVNQMRAQHKLGILETMVLGQASLCGALLLPTMKGKEHLTWQYQVDGPAQGFSIEADSSGYVRGYLFTEHIPVEKPLENWDLAPFLGKGTLTMATIHPGDKNPFTSSVPIEGRTIAEDLAYYFDQSEQIHTAFNTGIQMDTQGRVIGAGGFFLQVMPDYGGTLAHSHTPAVEPPVSTEALIETLENAFTKLPPLGTWFSEGNTAESLVFSAFKACSPHIALQRSVRYDCPCCKEQFLSHIKALPKAEIEAIKKEGKPLEIVCRNCSSVYTIALSEF